MQAAFTCFNGVSHFENSLHLFKCIRTVLIKKVYNQYRAQKDKNHFLATLASFKIKKLFIKNETKGMGDENTINITSKIVITCFLI